MFDVKPRVLCVDDDQDVLDGFKQNLRRKFNLHLATDPEQAIAKLKEKSFEVILSDMRMPGMNGAEFLHQSRKFAPDAVRLLLTGQCDVESAMSAVNDGQIFRFLTKPCASKDLQEVIQAAVQQHRLITSEKELLQKTLKGSIKVLVDALAITSPLAFGRAKRLHKRTSAVCKQLEVQDSWSVEIASMLSQLGAISLDDATLEKMYRGEELSLEQQSAIEKVPLLTHQLIGNIPRLEKVLTILNELNGGDKKNKSPLSIAAQILGVALAMDELELCGSDIETALSTVASRKQKFDDKVIAAFAACFCDELSPQKILEIPAAAIQENMIVVDNIYTNTGALLVARGFEIDASFAQRTRNFPKGFLKEPIRVQLPEKEPAES